MAVLTRDEVQTPLDTINREEIQKLIELQDSQPCVSIFMPTFRAGVETQQNPIRLKNLLRTVHERLVETGMEAAEATGLMAPVRELVDDQAFWQTASDGVAIFRSPEELRVYRLPRAFNELAVVENRFYLKPLFSFLADEGQFYVLAISLKSIRLILASHYGAREMEIPGVPQSLQEALGDLTRQSSQFQAATASSRGVSRSPIFHGHGTGEDNLKAEMQQFFNLADKALMKHMDRGLPVVLAGVEYLLPRYKDTTEHPRVLEEGLTGNAEGLSPEELREKAWEIVEPVLTAERRKAAERYGDLLASGRASSRYEDVLQAAHDGRIDTLFVARGVRLWGAYDESTRKVTLAPEQEVQKDGQRDLIDIAAVQTFLNGGTVYSVPREDVPEGQAMAALFRY